MKRSLTGRRRYAVLRRNIHVRSVRVELEIQVIDLP